MVALDAVARPEEDRLRTSSYRRSPRGTTLCPVLALSRSLYHPLTPPQRHCPQLRPDIPHQWLDHTAVRRRHPIHQWRHRARDVSQRSPGRQQPWGLGI